MARAQRGILLGEIAESVHRFRGDDAAGDLDANHLNVGLALAVDTLLQTKGRELRVFPFTGHERRRLLLQPHNLVFHEGNDALRILGKLQALFVDGLLGSYLGV